MITSGEGKYKVFLEKKDIGNDIVYILGGGERSHIGSIIIADPNGKTDTIKLENHKDYVVLEPIAKVACEKYKTRIVAVGGIHIDNATKDEIEIIVKNCKELEKCI